MTGSGVIAVKTVTARKLVLFLIAAATLGACTMTSVERAIEGAPSHHTTKGFRNLYIEDPNKTFFSFLRVRLFGDEEWADHSKTAGQVPFQMLDLERVQAAPLDQLQISWLGHSTFLIQYQGTTILTDPIFSDRASPTSWAGPKRYVPHVVDYDKLPPVDFVVISHNHYDHLNEAAVQTLGAQPLYLVPLGLKRWFLAQDIPESRIVEMDWWQTADPAKTGSNVRIEAQPSQHWSARGLFDRRATLWASWRIQLGDKSLWFAGDTGYNPQLFREIGAKRGPVDLALIPIGAYDPRSFMSTYHVDPDEAVMIHRDIGAAQSIGMHWGTYPLTAEEPMDPPRRLAQAREREGISEAEFRALDVGQTILLEDAPIQVEQTIAP